MEYPLFFSDWIKRRRQELDLTQVELANRASCSVFALRKIEAGERRPSKQLAGLLAKSLEISPDDQTTFIRVARGELSIEKLRNLLCDTHSTIKTSPVLGNLPRELTSFIGREPELTALAQLLNDPQCSLLTIVGPGGIGKTRLAIEAVHHSKDLFPDGTWFVSLASLNSPVLIVPAIADVVGFKFQDPTDPQAELLRYLRTKKTLLVLDNAEHLLEGAEVFTEILKNCQQIKLLVTSRERLNLLSEWVFEIQGLPVPPNVQVNQFDAYSSVALFLQSAKRVHAGFEIRGDERQWVLKICQIMEGMPLGIELSAAWVGLLSCKEIAQEIQSNFDFLSASLRDLPERHRSLRATLDHSWKLLNDEERVVISRLAVFRSNFSLEAAQEICGASLSVLASLKNKSLLYRTDQEFYSLHEIIHQYAELKLRQEPSEYERVKDRHAAYYVQRLSKWEKALQSSRQLETFNEMALVIDNLSLAWQHMVTSCRPGNGRSMRFYADLLHSALFSISLFYEQRCRSLEAIPLFRESVEYMKTVQSEFEGTEEYSPFISVLGHITGYLGLHHYYIYHYEKTSGYYKEALQLLEDSQSSVEKAQVEVMLASFLALQGQLQDALALLVQSREVFREAEVKWWYALSTAHLGQIYINLGKIQESEALFQEGFQLVESGDLRSELPLRNGFAYVLYLQADYARAEQLMRENLQLSYLFGNFRYTASILVDLGRVALATQRIELAIEFIQKSIHLLNEFGETRQLASYQLDLGKCYAAQANRTAARDQFRKAIKIGQEFDLFHLVYWGLANIARIYLDEGQTQQALQIFLLLRHCPIEYKRIQEDFDHLQADLKVVLPEGQIETAMKPVDSKISLDIARADVITYVQEHETG
jgi:predicted ATPase/transcriptional regulator with XRE-family HTH domain